MRDSPDPSGDPFVRKTYVPARTSAIKSDAAYTLGGIAAFDEFLRDLPQRCAELPIAQPVTVVGSYRMFGA